MKKIIIALILFVFFTGSTHASILGLDSLFTFNKKEKVFINEKNRDVIEEELIKTNISCLNDLVSISTVKMRDYGHNPDIKLNTDFDKKFHDLLYRYITNKKYYGNEKNIRKYYVLLRVLKDLHLKYYKNSLNISYDSSKKEYKINNNYNFCGILSDSEKRRVALDNIDYNIKKKGNSFTGGYSGNLDTFLRQNEKALIEAYNDYNELTREILKVIGNNELSQTLVAKSLIKDSNINNLSKTPNKLILSHYFGLNKLSSIPSAGYSVMTGLVSLYEEMNNSPMNQKRSQILTFFKNGYKVDFNDFNNSFYSEAIVYTYLVLDGKEIYGKDKLTEKELASYAFKVFQIKYYNHRLPDNKKMKNIIIY